MLVTVAGILCSVSTQLKWILDRNAAVNWRRAIDLQENPRLNFAGFTGEWAHPAVTELAPAPWSIRILGARGAARIDAVEHEGGDSPQLKKLYELFPEAEFEICRIRSGGSAVVETIDRRQ